MLDRIANYLRKEVETRGKVRAAMAYPAVMMLLAVGVTIFLLTYILPKFTPMFVAKGMDLPAPTKLMMGISDALMLYWYLWAAAGVSLVVGYIFAKRTEPGRRTLDLVKINLPVLNHVPQGDHQPKHPHTRHHVGQRGPDARRAPPLRGSVGQLPL